MEITKAILHILDREAGHLICSQAVLDLNEYAVKQYLEGVVKQLQKAEFKLGQLSEETLLYQKIKESDVSFEEKTADIAQDLFDSLAISEDAPSGDLLFFEGKDQKGPLFGIVKFNYKPSYTHFVDYQEDIMQNNIILNKTIFPSPTQRIEECLLVDQMTYQTQIVEKKYQFEGQKRFFITERWLKIDPTPTVTENLKIVKKAVKEISNKYNESEFVAFSQAQQAIFESIEEQGSLDNQRIAESVFETNLSAQNDYLDLVKQTRFSEEIPNNVPKYEKKYSKQKFKLTNGIELTIPVDVFKDKEIVEFINHPDGTLSVMIKNVEEVISKF
ncbi:nucleoid-associated protein [Vagococcus sp.]|uniref:nucleoid-associated protein n=1 Tax=Vagococcus sp. TaxID=1933889 RepID=UPI003F9891A4